MMFGVLAGALLLLPSDAEVTASAAQLDMGKAQHITLHAERDPENPTHYLVVDDENEVLLRTNGRDDAFGSDRILD